MPRLRDNTQKLTRVLRGYSLNGANLSIYLGCAPATARKKLDDPTLLTVGDLLVISRRAHIPIDEIREAITV